MLIDLHADRDAISASTDRSIWRYAPLLPVSMPSLGPIRMLGGTPLYRVLGHRTRLWLKDDGLMPTGSLKDRASAVVVRRAEDGGYRAIIAASTGNAGVATAAMAQSGVVDAIILVPESAPPAKIAQLLVYGAELYLVRGSYDDAFALSREASRAHGWYCRNTAYNPFTAEGKKTVAFEICEQLDWKPPDRIYVSVGDGNIITGVHKGLCDLRSLGWIDRMPKLIGVQAEGSAAIARAFAADSLVIEPVVAKSIADSICANMPADGFRALRAVRETGGHFVVVNDAQILTAIAGLGRQAGVFAEPAAAAAYAGFVLDEIDGAIDRDEDVVVICTGNGLKDIAAAQRAVDPAPRIDPSLDALNAELAKKKP